MSTASPELVITEIYASIQGESTYSGLPCAFVRLTGCNLRCTYCDTEYAFYGGTKMAIDSVVEQVRGLGINLVEITGGEPLLQKGCVELASRLVDDGYTVLIETSGERPIDVLPEGVVRIMDVKCPSSGESEKMNWANLAHLTTRDEVKFVIGDRADYDWASEILTRHDLPSKCTILMSTVFERLKPRELCAWILADHLPVRFQLQAHKFIWDRDARGV